MQTVEDLNLLGLKIVQDDKLYKFTSDAILLSRFAKVKKNDLVADYCSGSGIVGLHLYGLNANLIKSVDLFELQKPMYDLSVKSVELNGLKDKFFCHNIALQDLPQQYYGKFSLIVCNPPYTAIENGFSAPNETLAVCRSEVKLSLRELVKAFALGLKYGGSVCMCHRADRLAEIICEFKSQGLEPKRMQLVSAGKKEPYLVLIEGVKGGKSGIKILSTLTN